MSRCSTVTISVGGITHNLLQSETVNRDTIANIIKIYIEYNCAQQVCTVTPPTTAGKTYNVKKMPVCTQHGQPIQPS